MANAMIKNRANHEEVLDESRHAANAVKVCWLGRDLCGNKLIQDQKLIVKIIEMEMSKLWSGGNNSRDRNDQRAWIASCHRLVIPPRRRESTNFL
jgi:hypothetical protein